MANFTKINEEIKQKENAPDTTSVPKKFNWVKANYVSIVDIDTPFKSMVLYYFKWSFAVIPTMIFWGIVYVILIYMNII